MTDPIRGETERLDILNLMKVLGISTAEEAIALLGRYFPVSAASSEKQRFLLKNINREGGIDAPKYPR
jgi:protein-tyrosine phosphatase